MLTDFEIWFKKHPKRGDHIRVSRTMYYHHGIYISGTEVIHFNGDGSDNIFNSKNNKVIKTTLNEFLKNGKVEVKIYSERELNNLYPVDHIVEYTRACLGDTGYNLIFNNCEHFANICTLGKYRSKQVDLFFNLIIGGKEMGIVSKVTSIGRIAVNSISSVFGNSRVSNKNRSISSTKYEPDKVKIAEKEIEKIKTAKEAKLEIMKANEDMQFAIEEAKSRGMLLTAQVISKLHSNLMKLAEDSFKIVEGTSLEIIKEIENFYDELEQRIRETDINYREKKLPLLLKQINEVGEDSPLYEIFKKNLDEDMSKHISRIDKLIEDVSKRKDKIIDAHLKSRDKMIENTAKITEKLTAKYSNEENLKLKSNNTDILQMKNS